MQDYFDVRLSRDELQNMSSLALAHMGDGVYEVLVRSWLCVHGRATAGNLHREAVAYVCAPAQAKAMEKILPLLTEEEAGVYRRGRNAHVSQIPKNATRGEYNQATGLEAVFGYLYLSGRKDRISQLFAVIVDEEDESNAT